MNNTTTRAILYTTISALAAGSSWLTDAPDAPTWKQWATLAIGCLVASLTSLRAYLDGSAERARQSVQVNTTSGTAPILPLALLAGMGLFLSGCAHTPEAQAYFTLHHTKTVVLEAMDVYAVQLATGQVDPETERKIDDAYLKWCAAFEAAVEMARFDYGAATPDTVKRLALGLVDLIDDL
jgi:hypothetical protein